MSATCSSCHAAITWALTESGAKTPLDAAPVADGGIVLEDGVARVLRKHELAEPADQPRYKSHWASCPEAKAHRRPRP